MWRTMTTTRTTTMTMVSQLWDQIETWDFRVDDPCDFPDVPLSPHKKFTKPNIM